MTLTEYLRVWFSTWTCAYSLCASVAVYPVRVLGMLCSVWSISVVYVILSA